MTPDLSQLRADAFDGIGRVDHYHVAALAVADDSIFHDGQCGAELARSSYVVSHCAVKAFRVADRIEHGPMHYLRFAARLGIGLRMPAPQ